MNLIEVKKLSKVFKKPIRGEGLKGMIKTLFSRKYQEIKAVDDISFNISSGEIVGYIGANGAGKSTTIKMMCGILHPSNGTVVIDGMSFDNKRKEINRNMGVVFGQKTQLWWDIPLIETFKILKSIYEINDKEMTFEGEKMLVYKICNTITYIASQVIAKHLKKFAINSGVPEQYHDRIHMKSEFLFRKMLLTNTKKRYMAKIMLREGTVYEKREIKGLDFLKSECNEFTREFISNLMNNELLEKTTDEIIVKNVVNGVRELAESVRMSLENGEKK